MKEIQLTRGQVAKVCDCHAHLIEGNRWFAKYFKSNNSFYAAKTTIPQIYMHTVINATPKGFQTDHINGDTLDNRCSNLRTATPSQNQANQRKRKDNTSGTKGVYWNSRLKKWGATIRLNKKTRLLGHFETKEEAAKAYQTSAIELFGEFARI